MNIFLKELKNSFSFFKVLFALLLINFLIFLWAGILGESKMIYPTIELLLVIFGFIVTTSLYKKYNDPFFLKINKLNDTSKRKIQISLFLIVIIFMIFIFLTTLFFITLWSWIGFTSKVDVVGASYPAKLGEFEWWGFFFYIVLIEMFIIIFYTYFLNHFIRSNYILNGLFVVIIIYSIMFGNFFVIKSGPTIIDEVGFISIKGGYSNWRLWLSFIVTPWNQLGVIGARMFFQNSSYSIEMSSWWNYSEMDQYKVLLWTPYLTIIILFLIPYINKKIQKIRNIK